MRRIRISWRHARTGSARRNGLIVAAVVAVAFAGIIVWTVAGKDPRHQGSDTALEIEPAPPPDIKSRPVASANGLPIGVPDGSGFFWQIADRDDPSRRAGLVKAAKGTPGVGGSYILTGPEFFYYTKDGRLVHFTADKGEAVFPSPEKGSRPESGTFDGHVVFKLFEKSLGGEGVDPAKDVPSMVGTTTRLRYDGTMGELQLPDHFEVDGERGRFVGQNAMLAMNEAEQQLEWAVVDPGSVLTIKATPQHEDRQAEGGPANGGAGATAGAGSGPVPSGAPSGKPKAGPKVAFYEVSSVGGVAVEQSSRTIRSHEAVVWLRLVDNKLPVGALAEMNGGVVPEEGEPTTHVPDASPEVQGATPAGAIEATSSLARHDERQSKASMGSRDGPLTISFAGPLEIRLLDGKPKELSGDEVLVRFLAGQKERARFADAKAKAQATGDSIEYAATAGRLSLIGTLEEPATLALGDNAVASAARFDADLMGGRVAILGAGRLVSRAKATTPGGEAWERTLSWSQGATLGVAVRDGKSTSDLEWFKARGDVVAVDRSGTFKARELDASFAGVPGERAGSGKRYLEKMVLREGTVSDGKQGRLEGSELTAMFEPTGSGTNSTPTSIAVRGEALAMSGESLLEAETIDATLGRDARGRAFVEHAVAGGDARFEGRDGVWAKGELIDADVPGEVVDLSGPDVRLGQGKTFVQGSQMRLEGSDRQRLTVYGVGRFEHEGAGGARASASWTKQMTFEDSLGKLECAGDVGAMWAADDLSRDVAKAERVKMWFTPGTSAGSGGQGLGLPGVARGNDSKNLAGSPEDVGRANGSGARRLLRALAIGSIAEPGRQEGDGERATIESRRFAMVEGVRTLERLLYVEGETIKADEEAGALEVPGPGRLFTLDHRAAAERVENVKVDGAAKEPPGALAASLAKDASGARGEARFNWTGSLKADRGRREITLHEGVTLRHHRSSDGMLTDLECRDLVAMLGEANRANSADAPAMDVSGELRSAMAKGGVWLRNGTREITAQNLLYDAANGVVDAGAGGAGGEAELGGAGRTQVSVFDQGSATPLTARRIVWNLTTGRLEIKEPGTVVGPN